MCGRTRSRSMSFPTQRQSSALSGAGCFGGVATLKAGCAFRATPGGVFGAPVRAGPRTSSSSVSPAAAERVIRVEETLVAAREGLEKALFDVCEQLYVDGKHEVDECVAAGKALANAKKRDGPASASSQRDFEVVELAKSLSFFRKVRRGGCSRHAFVQTTCPADADDGEDLQCCTYCGPLCLLVPEETDWVVTARRNMSGDRTVSPPALCCALLQAT